jgi:carbamoyltransferase
MKARLGYLKKLGLTNSQVRFVNHHLSHASAAYYSIFNNAKQSKYLILTLDGSGDGLCATVNLGENGNIKVLSTTPAGHSLGNIYSRVTYAYGFTPWEHEYKLMGMAPYVPVDKAEEISQIFHRYLDIDPANPLSFKKLIPEDTGQITNRILNDFFRIRFDWVCAGLQKFTEDLILKWVKECVKKTGINKVICSGGVFMNVKANKRILELPEVQELFIMPSCGDETNSIGAAYYTYAQERVKSNEDINILPLKDLYLGNDITEDEIKKSVDDFVFSAEVKVEHYDNIEKKVAELLSQGEIVARAKGRMEFGARALGNRSILAKPSNTKVVRIINEMIKSRDFWMPFCPSVLANRAAEYYIKPKKMHAPYMIISFDSQKERVEEIIAAIHPYDFTTRPQEVDKDWNPDYWQLLKYYEELTGEGIILNTSFNLHGYPVVSTAKDALGVLDKSGLKYLALGNYLIWKI